MYGLYLTLQELPKDSNQVVPEWSFHGVCKFDHLFLGVLEALSNKVDWLVGCDWVVSDSSLDRVEWAVFWFGFILTQAVL